MSPLSPRLLNDRILQAALGQGAVADHIEEKRFTFTKVRARAGGSLGPD